MLRLEPMKLALLEVQFMEVLAAAEEDLFRAGMPLGQLLPEVKAAFMQLEEVVRQVHLAAMDPPEQVRRTLCVGMEAEEEQPD